jgi:integrase/recombinase XerD
MPHRLENHRRYFMNINEAIKLIYEYQKANLKKRSIESYNFILSRFSSKYETRSLEDISSDDINQFLAELTGGLSKATRRLRYAQLKTFFNFIIERYDMNMKNPCSSLTLAKTFRTPPQKVRKIMEKESVDEMIYNTQSLRDRLILELQARCGFKDW